jgi:hypothetical protein
VNEAQRVADARLKNKRAEALKSEFRARRFGETTDR